MPVDFTCPHCGTQTRVADQYIGHTGPCGSCGRTITIPGPVSPGMGSPGMGSPGYSPPPARRGGCGLGVALALIFVGVLFVGLFLALMLPAVQAAREAARRVACVNNLKQIGVAMHMYAAEYGCLPPPYTVDKDGNKLLSWRVLILPYLEEEFLYQQFAMDEPWDSERNRPLLDMMPATYRCPSNPAGPEGTNTDYLMITGPGTVGEGPRGTKLDDIHDGMSNTLLVAEAADSGVPWTQPADFDLTTMPRAVAGPFEEISHGAISSFHPGCANVLFCDGSVRVLSTDIDSQVLEAILTKDGGERAGLAP